MEGVLANGPSTETSGQQGQQGGPGAGEQAGQQETVSVWVLLSVLGTARAGSARPPLSDQLSGDSWHAPGVHSELSAPAWG